MTLSYLSFLYLKLHQMKMQSFPSLQYLVSTIKGLKLNGQRMVPVITMIGCCDFCPSEDCPSGFLSKCRLSKWTLSKWHYCPSAIIVQVNIVQVSFLSKCQYCPSDIFVQVTFLSKWHFCPSDIFVTWTIFPPATLLCSTHVALTGNTIEFIFAKPWNYCVTLLFALKLR